MRTFALTQPATGRTTNLAGSGLGTAAATLWAHWRDQWQRRQTRRYLEELDEHMLKDIGVSRAQALFEFDAGRGD